MIKICLNDIECSEEIDGRKFSVKDAIKVLGSSQELNDELFPASKFTVER